METKPDQYFTLITGASSGIGKSLATECAKRGMNLFLVALPDTGLEKVAAEIEETYSTKTFFLNIDLTYNNAYQEIYNFTKVNNLIINTLINNAGVGFNGKFESMPGEKIDTMIMLNLRATALLTNIFLKDLLQLSKAYILNMGSMSAFLPCPGKSIYGASKAFVLFFSKSLREELKHTGISVTSVYPYGVLTNDIVKTRIQKSGFLAHRTVLKPDEVARISIEGMLKSKNIIIPGRTGLAIFLAGKWIPQGLVLRFMEKEFNRAPQ